MKLEQIESLGNGYSLYEYTPNFFRLLYINFEPMRFARRIRLLIEYMGKGSYKVYYLKADENFVGYCLIAPGGRRLKCSSDNDIVCGPYFIRKEERGKGYAKILLNSSLENCRYQYKNAFVWIKKTNIPSIKTSEACGFRKCGELDVIGKTHKLVETPDGEYNIYMKKKQHLHKRCKD